MKLSNLIEKLSLEKNPVVLLEGKRVVKKEDERKLIKLGKILLEKLPKNTIFRTGNATGSDELFVSHIVEIAPERVEFLLPYEKHRKKIINSHSVYVSMEQMVKKGLNQDSEIVIITKSMNKKNSKLIEKYIDGEINRFTIKAPYLLRDTVKVTGFEKLRLNKASFAIFYDDLENPVSGGTGHTIKVCENQDVECVNQTEWLEMLE